MGTYKEIASSISKNPDKLCKIIEELEEDFGKEIIDYFTCHINDLETYQKFVSCLKNFDGTIGAHWTPEQIDMVYKIDFNTKEYTKYDFAYIANMRYSDDGDLMPVENLFRSAQRYLEDKDYYGNPSERAYDDGKIRYEYFHSEH